MIKKSNDYIPEYSAWKVVMCAALSSLLFWFIESLVHVYVFNNISLFKQLFTPDMHEIWMRIIVVGLFAVCGAYTHRFIKRIVNAEHKVCMALAELDQIFLTSGDGMWVIDPEGNVVRISETFANLSGKTTDSVIGKKCYEVFPGPQCHTSECPLVRIIKGEESVSYEADKIRDDGGIAPCLITATALRVPDGRLIAMVENFKDFTQYKLADEALRQSEEKYRSLFEESRDAIYITTRNGEFVDVNKAAVELFEYTKDELIGMLVQKVYMFPENRVRYQKTIEEQGFVRDYEIQFRKKNNTPIDCLLTATLRRDRDNNIIGYQGIIRDVTEQRRIERELLKIHKLESIGVLAGGIAHDFNNILTAILGNIAVAKMSAYSHDNVLLRLAEAEKACMRARDLTHQLLTFSKGGEPVVITGSIGELLVESVGFMLRGGNVRSEFVIAKDLWPVDMDEGQINQVINNLIVNAQEAMPEGGTIKVAAENILISSGIEKNMLHLPDGRYVRISIKDQGVGIPREYQEKIFDPYFSTKKRGSGLGLAITYSIIKRHHGYIMVDSHMPKGTAVIIYLPASDKQVPQKAGAEKALFPNTGKALVMDDDENVRDVAVAMLENIGYAAIGVKDGAVAIDVYRQALDTDKPFNFIIMDLTVPGGMGGMEAVEKLRKIDPQIKAIVSSGYSNDPIMANYREHGFSGMISKPYRMEELKKTLNEVFSSIR
ncbi:MAG: PAS domain S-box protein [Pseudomonadota bacterium]